MEVLETIEFPYADLPPHCRRREDQLPACPCMPRGRPACRQAVAVLAAADVILSFECVERGLLHSQPVSRGLNIFTYCSSNVQFGGLVPSCVAPPPPLEGVPVFIISGCFPEAVSWLPVRTSGSCFSSMPWSLEYPFGVEYPSRLACVFNGAVPLSILLQPNPVASLGDFMPGAVFYLLCISHVAEEGPLLSRYGGNMWPQHLGDV